ncbi:lamin tail domain-containing protein [Stackebrandtia nassauensis]|nr:endonuclease/exonuclease/phosphatase family protein [Stackebrandtia nassauensis]
MGRSRLGRTIAVVCAATLAGIAFGVPPVAAASSDVVLNEVYGGGGNSGATLTNDFIELTNRDGGPVDVSGWSVQYHSASATGSWQVTPLTGQVAPGQFYLIAEAAGSGGTQPLPTPDVTGTIPMGGTGGTVALVKSTTALTCTAADCAGEASIVDLVGYGSAAIRETNPAAGASNTLSVQRKETGDTDDNAADFAAADPTPKVANDGGDPGPECPAEPGPNRIHDIQGDGWISPLHGDPVADVPGVVTAVRTQSPRGYWIQDTAPDSDAATSEAVFVYAGSAPVTVQVGDAVSVSGKVSDFYQLSSGETFPNTANLSITEITNPVTAVCSSGNPLPSTETVAADSIPDVYAPTAPTGNVEDLNPVDASRSTMDFWEAREGMLVSVSDARVVGPGNEFGEIYLTVKPDEYASERGGTVNTGYDNTPTGRIVVFPVSGSVPPANVGDTLTGATSGPVDYSLYGGYGIAATQVGGVASGGIDRQVATAQTPEQLAVATYNVENLSPKDSGGKFAALAEGIVTNLAAPDVVVLEEIQDNNGSTNDAVVDADQTLDKLTAAITAAGGPRYDWRQISPTDDADGGQPGGNIRVAFLFNPDRVSFVDREGGDATTPVTVGTDSDGTPSLNVSPGRIDPANEAWKSSRKPLAGEFRFNGEKVIVVANHFNSKGGDQNADGRYQPPERSTEVQRIKQAKAVNAFVKDTLAVDADANVVVAGDINDYQFSPALDALTDGEVLEDLITGLPDTEQYTYVYNGISQVLDHILVSPALAKADYEVVHINAEFAEQNSDHDPQVARLNFPPKCTKTVSGRHIGPLTVKKGVTCLDDATQIGTITVKDGASLHVVDSTITGPLKAEGAKSISLCSSKVVGTIAIDGSSGPVTLGGDCDGNRVVGRIGLTDNTGGVTIVDNTLVGSLACTGNDPAPTGEGNRISGSRTGQCKEL